MLCPGQITPILPHRMTNKLPLAEFDCTPVYNWYLLMHHMVFMHVSADVHADVLSAKPEVASMPNNMHNGLKGDYSIKKM